MKEKILSQLKNDIRNYFYTIYANEHISTQETEMCLNSYLRYILIYHDIDLNSIRFVIHKVKEQELDLSESAKMSVDGNLFEIFLNKKLFSINNINKLENIIRLFISHGHEVQHILQYILAYNMMDKYDNHIFKLIEIANNHDIKYSSRENKKLVNKLTNLYAHNLLLSRVELNAVYRSFSNLENIIHSIIQTEQDSSFKNFLDLLLYQLAYIKQENQNETIKSKENAVKNLESIESYKSLLTKDELKEIYIF